MKKLKKYPVYAKIKLRFYFKAKMTWKIKNENKVIVTLKKNLKSDEEGIKQTQELANNLQT